MRRALAITDGKGVVVSDLIFVAISLNFLQNVDTIFLRFMNQL